MKFESKYLVTDQKTVNVVGTISDDKKFSDYVDNKGYVKIDDKSEDDSGTVWIFVAAGKPLCPDKYPYFWFVEDNTKIEFSHPDEFIMKAFSFSNSRPFDLNAVIENTAENEQLFDEQEIADMNAAASFFIPIIKENDDFLKKIIKSIIINKKIDISKLKSKTDEKYQLPNMKAALISKTSMSVKNFMRWISLLGCEFEMVINDDSDIRQSDVLKNSLLYQSNTNKMYELSNNHEVVELNQSNYTEESGDDTDAGEEDESDY